MSNVPISLVPYKQTKEDIKEIVKDLKTKGRDSDQVKNELRSQGQKIKRLNEGAFAGCS